MGKLIESTTVSMKTPQDQLKQLLHGCSDKLRKDIEDSYIPTHLISRHEIEIGKFYEKRLHRSKVTRNNSYLGKGQYGRAILGKYEGQDVCIKTCRKNSEIDFKDLFEEAVPMKHFEHENVMRLIGVSFDSG